MCCHIIIQAADMEKTLDDALAAAAKNLAHLEHVHNVTAEPNLQQMCASWLSSQKENIK